MCYYYLKPYLMKHLNALKSKAKKAKRSVWHAEVVFDNKLPAIDFETGLSTTVTLWEKDSNERFNLGKVSYKGLFNAAFSETEIEALKAGRMWLTLTVGNWLTKAKREDLRLDLVKMSIDPQNVVPVEVAKPRRYHGRVLFDDGSPAATWFCGHCWASASVLEGLAGAVLEAEREDRQTVLGG